MSTPIGNTQEQLELLVAQALRDTESLRPMSYIADSEVGVQPSGKSLKVEWELIDEMDSQQRALVVHRFQDGSGSTQEKIALLSIKLLIAMKDDPRYRKAWVVLGGGGWDRTLMDFFRDGLSEWIPELRGKVVFLTTDEEFKGTSFADF